METKDSPFFDTIATAVTGSLLGQVGAHRGYDPETMLNNHGAVTQDIATELADMGLSPRLTTEHFLRYFVLTCLHEDHVDHILTMLAQQLWITLGDPESGQAPPLYRKAAACALVAFLKAVDPSVLTFIKDD